MKLIKIWNKVWNKDPAKFKIHGYELFKSVPEIEGSCSIILNKTYTYTEKNPPEQLLFY